MKRKEIIILIVVFILAAVTMGLAAHYGGVKIFNTYGLGYIAAFAAAVTGIAFLPLKLLRLIREEMILG